MWRPQDWAHLQADRGPDPYPMWQDARHVYLQYMLAMSGLVHSVLEVGCHHGYSTSAYVQALADGAAFELTCCDTRVTEQLMGVLSHAPHPVNTREFSGIDTIHGHYDLIVLDGDHSIRTVSRELGLCLLYQTHTIILHDFAAAGIANCEGAVWAGLTLQWHPDYQCAFDLRRREGEFTDRGLLVATRSADVLALTRSIIDTW